MQIPNVISSIAHSVLPTNAEGKILPLSSMQKVALVAIALTTAADAMSISPYAKFQQACWIGRGVLFLTTALLAKTEVRAASTALYLLTSPRVFV